MKRLFRLYCGVVVAWLAVYPAALLAQSSQTENPVPIPVKVNSYQISGTQSASLYEKAELIINDENQFWEIILYRKGGDREIIKMETFDDIGKDLAVFRTITIQEGGRPAYIARDLFAYMPVFNSGKIQIDLCNAKTEGVRRRIILAL
jgi:hypothetical protein